MSLLPEKGGREMLESRSAYGYYGEHGGASGEIAPKTHKSGWRFMTFHFKTNYKVSPVIEVKACDYDHAIRQAKKWAKRDGFEIIGDADGCESQVNW